jgi:pimeloyl-ACP methyl ester carboxylesterase
MKPTPMKTKILQKTFLSLVALALVGIAPVRTAIAQQPGPLDISGEINGAPFRIVVPADWNGTLLLFQRGYTDKADYPGEIDNRNPTIVPNAAVRDALLADGYALSGSARKDNGWSVEEGLDDVVALASYFRENVANPTITILWGVSLGSVITLETAERNGGLFDGYLALSSVGAGATRTVDHFLVLRLAYDVTFGMPMSWGTPGDVRDLLDFEAEVLPILSAQAGDPANFGWFEFIRLVAGIPGSGIEPPPGYFPGHLISLPFFLATEGEQELERRAGGPVAQNITHTYALTPDEKVYLASLGVDADPLLEAMNARRNIVAAPEPRNYVEHFADYSGLIKHPVLTLHTKVDEVVVVASESAYRDTIAAVGRDDLLVQVYTTGIGHGTFTAPQLFAAIQAIEEWARSGTPPAPSAFPAELGFIPGYVPPACRQP